MILCRIIAMGMLLAAAQARRAARSTEEIPDEVKVVTYNIGAENEDIYDPAMEWFSGVAAYQMIDLVRIEFSETDGIKFIKCIGFSHSDLENNCPAEPSSSAHEVVNFQLNDDEYINFVSGDSFLNILAIYFRTNTGREIGPFGTETDPEKHMFKLSHDTNAPLLYVDGLKGLWVYSLYFSFHDVHVLNLENKTNDLANKTYLALNGEIDDLYAINQGYRRLYPDIARKGCAYWDDDPSIEAEIACDCEIILDQVNILTKGSAALENHAPRNLLTLKDYDSSKYLDEVKEAKDFHSLLTEIQFGLNTVIDVTEQQSAELSAYFGAAADFDQEIAEQDLIFIQGQIDTKIAGANVASDAAASRLENILTYAVSLTALEVVMEMVEFAAIMAAEFNPAKLVLGGGPDMGTIFTALEDLLAAVQDMIQVSILMANLGSYVEHLEVISVGLAENQAAVDAMAELVEVLTNETDPLVIEEYADEFIKMYGDYTPQVTSQDIVYIVTLLDTVADEACSILDGIETSNPAMIVPLAFALEECIYIPAEIAVLGSYYEDLYTLQFEMIDALTSIVKGQISVVMADRIGAIETNIDMRTAAIGSCMVEVTYQAASLSRCDILEYLAAGKRPEICENLLFRDEDIQALIAYSGSMSSSFRHVFAYIPTYPQSEVGIPHINITSLLRGGFQKIRLPIDNTTWLKEYGWLPSSYDPETGFFVSSLEVYIPGIMCNETGEAIHTVRIEATSSNPTALYAEDAPPKYSVDKHLVKFEYTEPSQSCAGTVMNFPVADNETLDEQYENTICVVSKGDIHVLPKDDFTYPSLFTTWMISLNGDSDCTLVEDQTMSFTPLITVRLGTMEVYVKEDPTDPGIDECWPIGSRCTNDETCVDEVLDYCCQDTSGVCD